jgi:FkbM family methyltransferase
MSVLISVCMITYNHENYIRQAVESVLGQEVSYPFELAIFNDASTDKTDVIIREIIAEHPKGHLITYKLHEKNIGLSANYIYSIKHCSGKYIAICEGDDYWIDNNKLQKQVDFMEQHEEYMLCFHQALRVNTEINSYDVYPHLTEQHFDVTNFFDIVTIPMASVVLRNNKNIYFRLGHSQMDFMMLCSLLMQGQAYFIKEIMSVYRVHGNGATFHHFTASYLTNRISNLGVEARMPEFSTAVRKEIAHMYVTHVLLLITHFRQELTAGQIMEYLSNSIRLRKREGSYFKEYKQIFNSLSPLVAKFSSLFNIKQMKHFLKRVYDKLTVRGFRDQLLHETKTTQKELAVLRDQLFTNNPVMVVGNMKICLPLFYADHIQKIIYQSRNYYELETLGFLRTHYKQFDHIIDIGSNIGNHMLYYCNYLAPKKVYCFEPNLFNRNQLEQNVSLNHLNKVVTVYPFALGATIGKGVQTDFSLGNTGMNRIDKLSDADSDEEAVDIRSLDSLNIPQANFMKIDVEGFEVEVLKGAGETIKRCKPVVMVEVFETNRPEVEVLMQGYGYKKFITLEDYNSIYVPL